MIHRTREPMTASLTTDRGLLSTSRKSTAGVSLPAFASYFLDAGSIGLLAEYRCYDLGIEILRELMRQYPGCSNRDSPQRMRRPARFSLPLRVSIMRAPRYRQYGSAVFAARPRVIFSPKIGCSPIAKIISFKPEA